MNVYCIVFPNNKKYIGIESVTGQRKSAHSRAKNTKSKTFVSKAIRKYKWENCKFIYLVKNADPQLCYWLEKQLICAYKLQNSNYGYNQSSGGEAGFRGVKMSEAHKQKISKGNKGKIVSQETREKLHIVNIGKKLSKEHREKISKSQIGRISGMKGKKHSEKTKNKIANAIKGEKNPFFGKKHTKEVIDKIIASNKRRARNATRKSS